MGIFQNLKAAGFKFQKGLGQNFIFDETLLASIVSDLGLDSGGTVVEIGTGAGTLTRVLANKVKRVITFEIDRRLEPVLAEQFKDANNITLTFADGLKTSNEEIAALAGTDFHMVANIPYYITTPLLMKFLSIPTCRTVSVLVQDDVAKRIVAVPGTADYGALSITMQTFAVCRITRKIPRTVFTPPPNVDSAFIKCEIRRSGSSGAAPESDVLNRETFDKLVKGLFAARRKTILNGLTIVFDITKEKALELLQKTNINQTARPESVEPQKYVELSNLIHLNGKYQE